MTYIIAEIGNNHNGNKANALSLVEKACRSEVNAVKLQAFTAENLVSPEMPSLVRGYDNQLSRMKSLELDLDTFEQASATCQDYDVGFIVSPFDIEWVNKLEGIVDAFKIASGEITNYPLIQAASDTNLPLYISTGMATFTEVDEALRWTSLKDIMLMHCVSLYPCPIQKASLGKIKRLKNHFPECAIGYSDHCVGDLAVLASIALGAAAVEKHFTNTESKSMPGDHEHSFDQYEMEKFIYNSFELERALEFRNILPDIHMRSKLRRGPSGLRGE